MDSEPLPKKRLTISDWLIATAVVAVFTAISIPLARIVSDPHSFASSIGYRRSADLLLVCTLGIIGFPVAIGVSAHRLLRNSDSPLRPLYVVLAVAASVGSIYMAIIVGHACAVMLI